MYIYKRNLVLLLNFPILSRKKADETVVLSCFCFLSYQDPFGYTVIGYASYANIQHFTALST